MACRFYEGIKRKAGILRNKLEALGECKPSLGECTPEGYNN